MLVVSSFGLKQIEEIKIRVGRSQSALLERLEDTRVAHRTKERT